MSSSSTSASSSMSFSDTFVQQFIVQLVNFITAAFAFVVALLLNESIVSTIDLSINDKDLKKNAGVKWATFFIVLIIAVLIIAAASSGVQQITGTQ